MKPDFALSKKMRKVCEREQLTFKEFGAQTVPPTNDVTVKYYIEEVPCKMWRDAVAMRFAKLVNKYELQWYEKDSEKSGKELQTKQEKQAKELRKNTIFERAKVVTVIMGSTLLSDTEKQKYISQFMD